MTNGFVQTNHLIHTNSKWTLTFKYDIYSPTFESRLTFFKKVKTIKRKKITYNLIFLILIKLIFILHIMTTYKNYNYNNTYVLIKV